MALSRTAPNALISIVADAAAQLIASNTKRTRDVTVKVLNSATNVIYLGGSTATTDGTNGAAAAATNKGLAVAALAAAEVTLKPGDKLYAFCTTNQTALFYAQGL